ncbi:MAG: hypothetical protein GXX91_06795 [Verrucomicrobiaceae bacterium]|nr:hypothetical protein [Verrucomicrobiaceae bacterium]
MKRLFRLRPGWILATPAFASLAFASCSVEPPPVTRMKLSQAIEGKAITVLREGLRAAGEEDFWVSMHAAEGLTLAGLGHEVIEFLEPKLETEKDARRLCGIARELVRAGKREPVAVLTEILSRPDPYGHTHAAESLYKVDEVGDETVMRERFENGGDIVLRLMSAAALARQGDAAALAFLRESRDGADPDGLKISAWVLGILGDESDIEPLRRRLADAPSPVIHGYIVNALAALGDAEGLTLLARDLEDPDPAIRTYAATFAGDARAYSTQARLEAMLDDPFPDARVRAAQTLLQLSR